jgi:copper chaperone
MSTPLPPSSHDASSPELVYHVDGMTCSHCRVAVTQEVSKIADVVAVDVDLDSKLVRVYGSGVDSAVVVAAIDEAGYDAVAA